MNHEKIDLPIDEIVGLWEERHSLREIADIYHVSPQTITRRLKEVGVYKLDYKRICAIRVKTVKQKYGVDNISQLEEIKRKKEQTSEENYGVPYYTQTSEYKERAKQTSLSLYGTESPNQSERVKQHKRECNREVYKRDFPTQVHFSDETYDIISDKEKFRNFIAKNNLCNTKEIAVCLGISFAKASRLIREYGCQNFIKRAFSYGELEVAQFLLSCGYKGQKTRKIIFPKEIDFFIPSKNFGVEFNGGYWHSTKFHSPLYHQEKSFLGREKGIFIFNIFPWDWTEKEKEGTKKKVLDILENKCYNFYVEEIRKFLLSDSKELSFKIDIGKFPVFFFEACGFERRRVLFPQKHDFFLFNLSVEQMSPWEEKTGASPRNKVVYEIYDNGEEEWVLNKKKIQISKILQAFSAYGFKI